MMYEILRIRLHEAEPSTCAAAAAAAVVNSREGAPMQVIGYSPLHFLEQGCAATAAERHIRHHGGRSAGLS